MWFILLFTVCALAIPIALEIHVKGSDNIISRSGEELLHSRVGKTLGRLFGLTKDWAYSLFALGMLFAFAVIAFKLLPWLWRLIF